MAAAYIFVIIWMIQTQSISCGVRHNVAEGKPAYQISTNPANALPSLAVDTDLGSMSHTYGAHNPWWYVDLLQTYTVTAVTVHNRYACCPDRMKNVHIGVTDTDPATNPPSLDNYPLCAINTGNLPGGPTMIQCSGDGVSGRYVIVQTQTYELINIVEVVVSVLGNQTFTGQAGSRLPGYVTSSHQARSELECARFCALAHQCSSFNYHAEASLCEVISASKDAESGGLTDVHGWHWYQLDY